MKTPSKKTLVIVGSVILLIFILRMVKSRIENNGSGSETNPNPSESNASIIPFVPGPSKPPALNDNCDHSTVLKKGDKSLCVQYAQKQINLVSAQLGISKLTEDGIFGSKTEAAFVKLLEKKTGTYKEVTEKRKFIQ